MDHIKNKFKLTTLTPTAILNGEVIDSFEYSNYGNYIYRLDLDKILNHLIKEITNSIEKISDWVDNIEEIINQNENAARHTSSLRIFDFIQRYLKKPEITQWLEHEIKENRFIKYKIPSNLDQNSSRQIAIHIKTANNQVYIPGSTLKGLIRTTLLNEYLYNVFDSKDANKIKKLTDDINFHLNQSNNSIDQFAQSVISDFFKFRSGKYDAKNDIMKFIRVCDTNAINVSDACEVVHPEIFTRNGKKQQGQLNPLEVIKSGVTFEFTIDFDIDFLRNTIKNIEIKDKKYLEESLKLFNISSIEVMKNEISQVITTIYQTIEDSLFNYSIFVSEKNDSFIQSNKKIKGLKIGENDIIAQIGWGTGFHTKTILFNFLNLYWKDDETFKEIYKTIFQKYRIRRNTRKNNQNVEINLDTFPTSRRTLKINNQYQQLGWVKIERL